MVLCHCKDQGQGDFKGLKKEGEFWTAWGCNALNQLFEFLHIIIKIQSYFESWSYICDFSCKLELLCGYLAFGTYFKGSWALFPQSEKMNLKYKTCRWRPVQVLEMGIVYWKLRPQQVRIEFNKDRESLVLITGCPFLKIILFNERYIFQESVSSCFFFLSSLSNLFVL